MIKDVLKSLIAIKQNDIPTDVISRDIKLPINRKKIITVPGVRRCGKSTLMDIVINELIQSGVSKERILWLGFDDERLKSMKSDELDAVISSYMEMYPDIPIKDVYMFFDEIQIIEDWEFFVMRVFKSYCQNIYISGSNASMLSKELKTALRGWPLEYETYPLSFNEFCHFKGVKTDSYLEQDIARVKNAFAEYNQASAFPEVVLTESKTEKLKILQGYFDTMLLKDMIEHYKLKNAEVVRYFLKRIMANLTKPTSILSIYKDIKSQGLKVTKDDLYFWADCVCNIFMFIRIPKYETSLAKEQKSLNKYYCIDNGLRSAVLMPQSDDNGKLLENTVFLNLHRTLQPLDRLSYYRDKVECYFVLQRNEHIEQLIQVTWNMTDPETRGREITGLLEASKATKCDNLLIITNDEQAELNFGGKTIAVIPAWKWLLNNKVR